MAVHQPPFSHTLDFQTKSFESRPVAWDFMPAAIQNVHPPFRYVSQLGSDR